MRSCWNAPPCFQLRRNSATWMWLSIKGTPAQLRIEPGILLSPPLQYALIRAPHDTGSNDLSKMHGEKAIGSLAFRCGACNTSDEYRGSGASFGGYRCFCAYNYCERCPPTGQRCPTHRADYRKLPARDAESPGERHSRYFKTAVGTKFPIVACCVPGDVKLLLLEREMGFEPTTSSLGSWLSTTELLPPVSYVKHSRFILLQKCRPEKPRFVLHRLGPLNPRHLHVGLT